MKKLSIYFTRKKIKKPYKNNKFKISAPAWKKGLNYQISDTQDHCESVLKKHGEKTDNPSLRT